MEVISLKVLNLEGLRYLVSKIKSSTVECAKKLSNTSAIGSATRPVYFNNKGVPVEGTYTLGSACEKGVSTSIVSGDENLVTGDAVSKAIYASTNYEEGTWTPTDNYAKVSSYSNCRYIKIGKLVFLSGYMVIEPNGSETRVVINGLPFVPLNNYNILSNIYTQGDNLHRYNSGETVETMRFGSYGGTYFKIYDIKATSSPDFCLYLTYPKVKGTTIYLNVVYTIS